MTNQVIRPPNPLRAKVGGGFGGIDANAIARAEEALKAMSAQFGQWLNDEVVRLDKAQSDIRSQGYTPETAEALYFRAHDLKGLGTTYEYPLVTRIAASLCRMLDDADKRMQAPGRGRRPHRRHQGRGPRQDPDRRPSRRTRSG